MDRKHLREYALEQFASYSNLENLRMQAIFFPVDEGIAVVVRGAPFVMVAYDLSTNSGREAFCAVPEKGREFPRPAIKNHVVDSSWRYSWGVVSDEGVRTHEVGCVMLRPFQIAS